MMVVFEYVTTGINRESYEDDVTFMAWVNYEGGISDEYQPIFSQNNGSRAFYVGKSTDMNQIVIRDGIGDDYTDMGMKLIPGTWQHIVYRRTDGVKELFVNGVKSSITAEASTTQSDGEIAIGYLANSYGYGFRGKIDEVMMFDRSLSSEEIEEFMKISPAGDYSNLIAYYTFDDGTAKDSSVNSNDGIIAGTPIFVQEYEIETYGTEVDKTRVYGTDITSGIELIPSVTAMACGKS